MVFLFAMFIRIYSFQIGVVTLTEYFNKIEYRFELCLHLFLFLIIRQRCVSKDGKCYEGLPEGL